MLALENANGDGFRWADQQISLFKNGVLELLFPNINKWLRIIEKY